MDPRCRELSLSQAGMGMGTGMAGTPIRDACSNGVSGGDCLCPGQSRPGVWEASLRLIPLQGFWCLQRHWVQGGGTPRLASEATLSPLPEWWVLGASAVSVQSCPVPLGCVILCFSNTRLLPTLTSPWFGFAGRGGAGLTVGLPWTGPGGCMGDFPLRVTDTLCSTRPRLTRGCVYDPPSPRRHPHPRVGLPQPKADRVSPGARAA